MKFILLVATVLVAALAVPHPRMVQQEWGSFKSKYVKIYNSADEEAKRLNIFHQNLIKIEEHNKLYKQGLSTFKMGVTAFADMTSEEFMAYVNKSGVQSGLKIRGEKVILSSMNAPPTSVDWRNKNVLTPVKDQGQCGSCWAFSSTGAMEAHYALKTGKLISLSEQQLVDCSRQYGNMGCDGGWPYHAFEYVRDNFISYEDSYPYEEIDGVCHQAKASPVKVVNFVNLHSSHENICNAVAKGPISIAVDANSEWQFYSDGVLEDPLCNPSSINHAVLLVGYDEGNKYWIIKNSWSSGWGEHGYMRLSYESNCGVEDNASYPVVE